MSGKIGASQQLSLGGDPPGEKRTATARVAPTGMFLAFPLVEPALRRLVAERGCPATAAEKEVIGATHAEVGAYLLGLWGLPYPIVEAVAHHHWPEAVEHEGFDVVDSIRLAECLAYEAAPEGYSPCEVPSPLDPAYVAGLGVGDRLDSWRELARKTVERCPQEV